MTVIRRMGLVLSIVLATTVLAYGQFKRPVVATPWLTIGGEVAKPVSLMAADLAKLPRQTARVTNQDGKEVTYEGFALVDVLKLAGVEFGTMLKGNSLGLYVVAEAADKFRVVFALPELDPAFTDRVIIIADKQNGAPLDPGQGPLRLVVPGEKRPARWVRQVSSLVVLRAPGS
jgi:DMSO/TMAO reductase YedYZ molybdopterin-dependent catalytic subunit